MKDNEQDLTREPEMVKAYRDTWTLGVHSYLAYLRDRLIVGEGTAGRHGAASSCRSATRTCIACGWLLDEVFRPENFRVCS